MGVLDGQLVAFLVPPIRAEEWIITPVPQHGEDAVIVQRADGTGLVLPGADTGTPVAVRPLIAGRSEPPTYPDNEVWIMTPLAAPETTELNPKASVFTLRSRLAGDDQCVGRRQVEDRSLRPKPIVLLAPQAEPTPFVAIAVTPRPTVSGPGTG